MPIVRLEITSKFGTAVMDMTLNLNLAVVRESVGGFYIHAWGHRSEFL